MALSAPPAYSAAGRSCSSPAFQQGHKHAPARVEVRARLPDAAASSPPPARLAQLRCCPQPAPVLQEASRRCRWASLQPGRTRLGWASSGSATFATCSATRSTSTAQFAITCRLLTALTAAWRHNVQSEPPTAMWLAAPDPTDRGV